MNEKNFMTIYNIVKKEKIETIEEYDLIFKESKNIVDNDILIPFFRNIPCFARETKIKSEKIQDIKVFDKVILEFYEDICSKNNITMFEFYNIISSMNGDDVKKILISERIKTVEEYFKLLEYAEVVTDERAYIEISKDDEVKVIAYFNISENDKGKIQKINILIVNEKPENEKTNFELGESKEYDNEEVQKYFDLKEELCYSAIRITAFKAKEDRYIYAYRLLHNLAVQ